MLSQAIQPLRFCALALLLLSTKANLAAADRVLKVPFEYASVHGSILLHASVNQKPVLLILDTGSTYTVLRPESLGLSIPDLSPALPMVSKAGFIGDAVGAEVTLELGGRKEKRVVAIMDLKEILSHYKEKIDGVLGLDFLLQFSEVTINNKEKTITFVEVAPSDLKASPKPQAGSRRPWVRRKASCL